MERAAAKAGIKGALQDRHFPRQGEQFWWPTGCNSRTQAVGLSADEVVSDRTAWTQTLFFFLVDYSFFLNRGLALHFCVAILCGRWDKKLDPWHISSCNVCQNVHSSSDLSAVFSFLWVIILIHNFTCSWGNNVFFCFMNIFSPLFYHEGFRNDRGILQQVIPYFTGTNRSKFVCSYLSV